MKIAVIGCGTMGRMYMERLWGIPDVKLTAVSNRSEEVLQQCAAQFGAKAYTSYEELLASSDADIVCVTLPTYLHKEVVLKAAAHGKHIICEKPLAMNPEDAQEMKEACEHSGVQLYAAHVLRFFQEYAQLRQQVVAGAVGRIGVAHAKRASKFPPADTWYVDKARSGGIILDLMIHDLDFLRWTLGEVKTVFASNRQSEGVDYAAVTLRFISGAIANVEAYWGYPGAFLTQVELAGTQGVLRYDSTQTKSMVIQRSDPEPFQLRGVGFPNRPSLKDPFQLQLEHFLACLRTGSEPLVTAEDGVMAVRLACAAISSLETGLPVRVHGKVEEGIR